MPEMPVQHQPDSRDQSEQPLTIRPITSIEDFRLVEDVQSQVWGVEDRVQIVPLHVLLTAQQNGGLVAGAFDASGQMIGFVFGFVGVTPEGKFKHCSHMAGVLPNIRRQNIGTALKLYQREFVLRQGLLDLITWTYDPLESVNAMLNIAKLGAISRHYSENHYGYWNDDLNRGIPTDRFEVEWWVRSPRVERYLALDRPRPTVFAHTELGAELVIDTILDENGVLHFMGANLHLNTETLLVEVPAEFQQVKLRSMDLARAWRMETRAVFEHYFNAGYSVCDFISEKQGHQRRNYYVLMKHVPGLPGL
jgi:predicted GNAT superfamily acetyltransferase